MKKAYVFFATGFEEVEALTTVDFLRRADVDARMVSITGSREVTGAHEIPVVTDLLFEDADLTDGDLAILPGGLPGATNLAEYAPLGELLKKYYEDPDKKIGAICAAPTVFGSFGIYRGERATCYPGFESGLTGATAVTDQVVVSENNVITSRAPGTAIPFVLRLISELQGPDRAKQISEEIVYSR